ncbi:MAG: hypothetical protein H6765_10460 [Candidatus Peribacteria bacterium]|nr:MAG: hypothetical protein H6765_10460 [Candidatus Peribacteria bacterium]
MYGGVSSFETDLQSLVSATSRFTLGAVYPKLVLDKVSSGDWYLLVDSTFYPVAPTQCAGDCGNGALDFMEQCDDGNAIAGDGCELDCRVTEICDGLDNNNDGIIDE